MHEQSAARRAGEPAAIQRFLRLTRAEKVPRAAAVRLDPRVIVVAVRPARRIDLPGRDPGCAQHVDRERGFFPAAAKAGAPCTEGADRPLVRRAVADLLRVPFIDRQNGLARGKPFDPPPNLRVEKASAVAKLLLVYARMEHVIQKQRLRQFPREGRLLPQAQRVLRAGAEQGKFIIGPVADGACGIAPSGQQRTVRRKRRKLPLQPALRPVAYRREAKRKALLHPLLFAV